MIKEGISISWRLCSSSSSNFHLLWQHRLLSRRQRQLLRFLDIYSVACKITSLQTKSSHALFKFFWKSILLRALKSPKKFRTPSSANFLGSLYIWGFKLKSYYEMWTFWSNIHRWKNHFFSKNVVRVSIIWNVYFWRFLTFVSNFQMNEIQKRSCNNNGPASFLEVWPRG